MTTIYSVPSAKELRKYLRDIGWAERGRGEVGSLWAKGSHRVGVPNDENSESELVLGAIQRVAAVEQKAPKELLEQVRFRLIDRTELRAASDHYIADTIPLQAATAMVSSARVMLRTSATTAWNERSEIRGNYARRGDAVAESARMDHTKKGSFIIPILVPLPEIEEPDSRQSSLMEVSAPEPFERRVTRTFAQSLKAVQESIVEPAREPTIDVLYEIVERGVSREFCLSLGRILKEPSVAELGAAFSWAPGVPASVNIPKNVTLDSEARPLIEMAAEKLRKNRIDTSRIFSGKIVALRRRVEELAGEVAVSTIRGGRPCEIWIRLSPQQYDYAISWHRDARPVLVKGEIQRDSSRRLLVSSATQFHPLDETYIPGMDVKDVSTLKIKKVERRAIGPAAENEN
ncbi:hypothetical protein AB0395_47355 [Streptosporangium sp. NPDC051023]|uniref:hypothetical protein n=1 Tax=Streptosporangium sp. NPDC051023 TaxID=3155410 RepID=UPI003450C892